MEDVEVLPAVGNQWGTMVGAWIGDYTNPYTAKCCAICLTGRFGETEYRFRDPTTRKEVPCKAFSIRYIDDPQFGWYCAFSATAQMKGFTPSKTQTQSIFYHITKETLFYLPSPPPPAAAPTAQFECFSKALDGYWSSPPTGAYLTDVEALAACVNGIACKGVTYEEERRRWTVHPIAKSVELVEREGFTSFEYSGRCEVKGERPDGGIIVIEEPKREVERGRRLAPERSWWQLWESDPDDKEKRFVRRAVQTNADDR